MKFRVGDRVVSLENEQDITKGEIYTVTNISNDSIHFRDNAGDCRIRYAKDYKLAKETPMNLKDRIEALTGWDKEADDILPDIVTKDSYISIPCGKENGLRFIEIQANNRTRISPQFHYDSQCEKLRAFKDALLWLLDKSDIEKKKETKIEGLEDKVEEIQREIRKLKE